MITLGDLIRKGAVGKDQITGTINDGENGVCAIGAALEGLKEAGLTSDDDE